MQALVTRRDYECDCLYWHPGGNEEAEVVRKVLDEHSSTQSLQMDRFPEVHSSQFADLVSLHEATSLIVRGRVFRYSVGSRVELHHIVKSRFSTQDMMVMLSKTDGPRRVHIAVIAEHKSVGLVGSARIRLGDRSLLRVLPMKIRVGGVMPSSRKAAKAALSCPLPPSIISRFGKDCWSSSSFRKRRMTTS